jgi:manganese transport protein
MDIAPLKNLLSHDRKPRLGAIDFIKYIGPGFLVTIGFIDPGNWASDLAAGSYHGYTLLWVVTLATVMLIVLQHNAAHLGIVTGQCLSEAATSRMKPWVSRPLLGTAVIATIATALAEVLGSAIALNLLFGLDVKIGAMLAALLAGWMLFTNSYMKIERWIIGFVSLIGVSFIFELSIVHIPWAAGRPQLGRTRAFPTGRCQ